MKLSNKIKQKLDKYLFYLMMVVFIVILSIVIIDKIVTSIKYPESNRPKSFVEYEFTTVLGQKFTYTR